MRDLVEKLGGRYLPFSIINYDRVEEIRLSAPSPAKREKIIAELGVNPTAEARYRAEYAHGVYHSYKPGVDDGLDRVLGLSLGHASVIEIGGGPCTIAEKARKGLCLDLTPHPRLQDVGVHFIQGDICSPKSVNDILSALDVERDGMVVTVLSYCLDRVPDQVLALRHFARIVLETNGIGLITVYLPARPVSPGIEGLNYAHGEWITKGHDPHEDYGIVVRSCQANGLRFTCGGLTSHYSTSLDSFEELGCWVMVFRPA